MGDAASRLRGPRLRGVSAGDSGHATLAPHPHIHALTDTNLVFDIGANTGQDTAALLSRGLRAVAIQANPKLCADLRARCWLSLSAPPAPPPAHSFGGVLAGGGRGR